MTRTSLSTALSRMRVVVLPALLAATVLGAVGEHSVSAQIGEDRIDISSGAGLTTSNRHNLALCVDSLDPTISDEELRQAVLDSLERVERHPDFLRSGRGRGDTMVDIGCSGPARYNEPGFSWEEGSTSAEPIPTVDVPSEYLAFVFLVPGDDPIGRNRVTIQEYYKDGEVFAVVTTVVYLTGDDLERDDARVEYLTRAVGLRELDPEEDEAVKAYVERDAGTVYSGDLDAGLDLLKPGSNEAPGGMPKTGAGGTSSVLAPWWARVGAGRIE